MTVHKFPTGERIDETNGGVPDYEVGDLVALLSGGPTLTVLEYCEDCDTVDVGWFNGEALDVAYLPGDTLVHV